MRDLWFLRFSPGGDDAPCVADCDGSCGGGTCLLHSGLCCPNDSLEDTIVIENLIGDDLLEDLAAAAFPPGPGNHVRRPTTGRGLGRGKPTFLSSQQRALGVGHRARPPPEHAALSADNPWSATSSSSLETEPLPPSSPYVPRKKRGRCERGRRSWSLDMPHVSVAAAAHSENPSGGGGGAQPQQRAVPRPRNRRGPRACTHCDETETPQWRVGPYGAGTLCNACGIRYRNGKLVPGYRPSSSPSFRRDMHSNRYRKAVKLGEKKAGEDHRQRYAHDMPLAPAPAPDARPW